MKKVYTTLVVATTIFFLYLCTTLDEYDRYRIQGEKLIRKTKLNKMSAVMFDIDGTLVRGTQPIQSMIDLCNYAKMFGITVVLITARPETSITRAITKRQLNKHEIKYDALFFRPAGQKKNIKRGIIFGFHILRR